MAFSITRGNKTWIVGIYLQENEYFSTILRIYPGILTYHWNSMNDKTVHWTNLVYKAQSFIYIQYKVVFYFFKKNYVMMINHFSKGYLIVVYNCKFLTSIERGREQRQGWVRWKRRWRRRWLERDCSRGLSLLFALKRREKRKK